jgi:hypothetical protein
MAKSKTKPTATSVDAYLDTIPDEQRRKDCKALVKITGHAPQPGWSRARQDDLR